MVSNLIENRAIKFELGWNIRLANLEKGWYKNFFKINKAENIAFYSSLKWSNFPEHSFFK